MNSGRPTEPLPYLLTLVAVFALGVVVGTGFDSEPPPQTPASTVQKGYLAKEPPSAESMAETVPGSIESIVYHGNTRSRKFHAPWCYHYDCPNCTRVFTSRDEAIRAGYEPGGNCNP